MIRGGGTDRRSRIPLILGVLLLAATASGIQGCGSPKSKLLGKWQEIGKTEILEFFEDGRISITDKGATVGGSWSILADHRVKIEADFFGTTFIATGMVEGDTLRLDLGGKISEYKRIPK